MDRVGNLSDLISTVIADEARRKGMKEEVRKNLIKKYFMKAL